MAGQNHHRQEYQAHTIVKLDLFVRYAREWFPTFAEGHRNVSIIDLFAGPGKDIDNNFGSPLLLCQMVLQHLAFFTERGLHVRLIFNEDKKRKHTLLEQNIKAFFTEHPEVSSVCSYEIYNCDAFTVLPSLLDSCNNNPTLLIADQNGVRFLDPSVLKIVSSHQSVDILAFVSTQQIRRFGKNGNLGPAVDQLDTESIQRTANRLIHHELTKQLRGIRFSDDRATMHFSPFALRTDGGLVYGLVLASHSLLALDKFLKVTWEMNPENGNGSFDVYDDVDKTSNPRLGLFQEDLTRDQMFCQKLEKGVLDGSIPDNRAAFQFALTESFRPKRAKEIIMDMKRRGLVSYDERSPKITWEAYRDNISVPFTVETK